MRAPRALLLIPLQLNLGVSARTQKQLGVVGDDAGRYSAALSLEASLVRGPDHSLDSLGHREHARRGPTYSTKSSG